MILLCTLHYIFSGSTIDYWEFVKIKCIQNKHRIMNDFYIKIFDLHMMTSLIIQCTQVIDLK
jgi:hypothetical protein